MKKSFKALIAFVLVFIMMQGVYAAPGVYLKPDELRGGSVASGNMTPVVPVTPKPAKVKPTPKPTPTPAPLYSDVTEGDWFYPAVKAVTEKKYMNGTNDVADEVRAFEPNGKLTRAMFVTVLYRLAGSPEVKKATPKPTEKPKTDDKSTAKPTATPNATANPAEETPSFKDVKDGMWYSDAVAWATKEKIADGIDNNKFSPTKNITREQAVVMLYRYAKYKKTDTSKEANLLKYKDYAKIGEYAIDAFSWACGIGIIDGEGESKKLEPASSVTRAQAAKMIATYSGDMPKATEKPKATEVPKTTATPGTTAAPKATSKPAATAAPGTTAAPKATSKPTATAAPGTTAAPKATSKPAATAAPKK